jgi:lysozyme
MRTIPQEAVDFIKAKEQLRLTAYLDSGGVWTVGWGHTGLEVKRGFTLSQAGAEQALQLDLETARRRLYARVKPEVIDELTDHQYGALLSFVLNLGANPDWTIWKRLNAKRFDQVPIEMMRFVYDQDPATGKMRKVSGLVNRRADEVKFWSTDEPGSVRYDPPSSVTRLADTPAVATDPVPAKKSATIWAVMASPFLAIFAAIKGLVLHAIGLVTPDQVDQVNQVTGAISPMAAHSAIVGGAVSFLAVVTAVLGAILVLRKHNEAR